MLAFLTASSWCVTSTTWGNDWAACLGWRLPTTTWKPHRSRRIVRHLEKSPEPRIATVGWAGRQAAPASPTPFFMPLGRKQAWAWCSWWEEEAVRNTGLLLPPIIEMESILRPCQLFFCGFLLRRISVGLMQVRGKEKRGRIKA